MQRVTKAELKLMVARLMGYTDIGLRKQGGIRYFVGKAPGEEKATVIPNFPERISAAWQVVEAMTLANEADEMAHARATMFTTLCDEGSMWHMPGSQVATLICINYLAAHGIMVEVIEEPGNAR